MIKTQKLTEEFEQIREIYNNFNQVLQQIQTFPTCLEMIKTKDPTNAEGTTSTPHDARQQSRDQSRERQAAMDWVITEALVRNTAELMAKFMALLNEILATSMPTALKMSSGAARISEMPHFDWTRDKTIYQ